MTNFADIDDLDWSVLEDQTRQAVVDAIEESHAESSEVLQRLVNLASAVVHSSFAQLSLIGETQFVPASAGLQYPPEGQHTPKEESLCSVTIAYGDTLVVEDAAANGWVNQLPPVRSGAVGSYLGVPVRNADGVPVGALCTFDAAPRSWSSDDIAALVEIAKLANREIDLLTAAGTRTDEIGNLTEVIRQLVASDVGPLRTASIEVVGRYRGSSKTRLGGDWYDYVDSKSDFWFTIGDVFGHGLPAIASMTKIRTAIRASQYGHSDPAEVLDHVSAMMGDQRKKVLASALCARLNKQTLHLHIANAGHFPPILVRDGRASSLAVEPGLPVGVDEAQHQSFGFNLRRGDSVLMFTDGLIERRDESLDKGLQLLRSQVERVWAGSDRLGDRADSIVADVHGNLSDDVCVLIVQL